MERKKICLNCGAEYQSRARLCVLCNKKKRKQYRKEHHIKNRERDYKNSRAWIKNNKERYNEVCKLWSREYRKNIKKIVVDYYGGVCACCGEKDIRFLCVDHIHGGGNRHKKLLRRSDMPIYLRQENYPEGFQILCYNCNMGKSHYKVCPHKL